MMASSASVEHASSPQRARLLEHRAAWTGDRLHVNDADGVVYDSWETLKLLQFRQIMGGGRGPRGGRQVGSMPRKCAGFNDGV